MKRSTNYIELDNKNRIILNESFAEKVSVPLKGRKSTLLSETEFTTTVGVKAVKKIRLTGSWSLTDNHNLKFRVLSSNSKLSGKTIIFKGEIIKAKKNGLSFRIRYADLISGLKTRTIELKGVWNTDTNNRIIFKAAKAAGRSDILRFQGAWKVNNNNEVIYRYIKTDLKTRTHKEQIIIFQGSWDLGQKKLIYRLEGSNKSFFSFKTALYSKKIKSSIGVIRYQVRIKYIQKKVHKKTVQIISIFGKWDFSKDLSITFEAVSTINKSNKYTFTIQKLFINGNYISAGIARESGLPLELTVGFTKVFDNDAELFISLAKAGSDIEIIGGIRVTF